MDALTDKALMLRFQAGEVPAFEALYARHRAPLYRYFLRQASREAVDDLFQEVWLRVIRSKDRYRAMSPFAAYLYRVAHNVLVDHYRRRARALEQPDSDRAEPVDHSASPEAAYAADRLRARLARALDALPGAQREVFMLHQEAGLTLEEIGHVVGASRETVKSRLRYALNRLRKTLVADRAPAEEPA